MTPTDPLHEIPPDDARPEPPPSQASDRLGRTGSRPRESGLIILAVVAAVLFVLALLFLGPISPIPYRP